MIVKVLNGFLEVEAVGLGIWGPTDPRPGWGLPGGGGEGGPPPGIWPSPGHPEHPIAPGGRPGYPSHPIYRPPGFWGGAGEGYPTPPIYLPPKPTEPPPDGGDKPPPEDGGWAFVAEWGQWGYFPSASGAQPKR